LPIFVVKRNCDLQTKTIALIAATSFCEAKDTAESRFPAPEDLKFHIQDSIFYLRNLNNKS